MIVDELTVLGTLTVKLNATQVAKGLPMLRLAYESTQGQFGFVWSAGAGAPQLLVAGQGAGLSPVVPLDEYAIRYFCRNSFEGPFATGEASNIGITVNNLVDGATITPSISNGNVWFLNAGGSRTFAAPTQGSIGAGSVHNNFPGFYFLRIRNNTGGAIVTTFNAVYHLAWTDPAPGLSRTVVMYWDAALMWQVGVVSPDLA